MKSSNKKMKSKAADKETKELVTKIRATGDEDNGNADLEINQEINQHNEEMKMYYVEIKKKELAETVMKYVKKIDEERIVSIRSKNVVINRQAAELSTVMAMSTMKPQNEAVSARFVEALSTLETYASKFYEKLEEPNKLPDDIKTRSMNVTRMIRDIIHQALLTKNWEFKETQEVDDFIKEYYMLLVEIRNQLNQLSIAGCGGVCGSSSLKIKVRENLGKIENKMFALPLFFKLQARGKQAPKPAAREVTEPDPLVLDSKEMESLILKGLSGDFPELKAQIKTQFKQNLKIVENERVITKEAPKSSYMIAQEYFYGFGQQQNYKLALDHYLDAENEGVVQASVCLGRMYLEGKGVQRNDTKAHEHFQQAAQAGNEDGYYYLGYMVEHELVKGASSANKLEDAVRYYKRAAAKDQTDALTDMAFIRENGLLGEPDYDEALSLYKRAVEMKNARAMNNLAALYLKGVLPGYTKSELEREACTLYEQSAELGYVKGLTNLGICYLKGIGVAKDSMTAKKLFKEAATQKDPDAMFYVAYFKLKGASTNANDEAYFSAAEQLRYVVGADENHSDAHYYLGYLYENGFGVDQDYKTASFYYSKAVAVSGETNAKAMYKLGNMLQSGKMGSADSKRAYALYTKAAELGDKDAVYMLGVLHEQGLTVPQNVEVAQKLYEQGARMGHADSKVNLAMLMMRQNDQNSDINTVPENLLMEAVKQGNVKAQSILESTINDKRPLFSTMPLNNRKPLMSTGEMSHFGNATGQLVHMADFMNRKSRA